MQQNNGRKVQDLGDLSVLKSDIWSSSFSQKTSKIIWVSQVIYPWITRIYRGLLIPNDIYFVVRHRSTELCLQGTGSLWAWAGKVTLQPWLLGLFVGFLSIRSKMEPLFGVVLSKTSPLHLQGHHQILHFLVSITELTLHPARQNSGVEFASCHSGDMGKIKH